jgi:hypothetical protein
VLQFYNNCKWIAFLDTWTRAFCLMHENVNSNIWYKTKIKTFHVTNLVLFISFSYKCTFSRTDVLGEMLWFISTYKKYFTFVLLTMSMLYLCCCCFCCFCRRRCVFARYLVTTSECDIVHRLYPGWFLKWWYEDWGGGSEFGENFPGVYLKGLRGNTATSLWVAFTLT